MAVGWPLQLQLECVLGVQPGIPRGEGQPWPWEPVVPRGQLRSDSTRGMATASEQPAEEAGGVPREVSDR